VGVATPTAGESTNGVCNRAVGFTCIELGVLTVLSALCEYELCTVRVASTIHHHADAAQMGGVRGTHRTKCPCGVA